MFIFKRSDALRGINGVCVKELQCSGEEENKKKLFVIRPVSVMLPDIGPAGSVGKSEDRSLISGQTHHDSKNDVFNTGQNLRSRNDEGKEGMTD